MNNDPVKKDPFEEKIASLSPSELEKARSTFREKLHHAHVAGLNTCVHCGLCSDSCHYFLTDGETQSIPAYKLNLIAAVYKGEFTTAGRLFPALNGARHLDSDMIAEWIDTLFGRCSMCGRCAINCTVGINIGRIIRSARTVLAASDLVPPELQSTVNTALTTGNNMGIPRADWLDTVQWIEEELQQETGDPAARLPIDQVGAKYLYAINPREAKFFPLSLLAAAKVFYAAGESWTFSSDFYDVTNYGLFSGDDSAAGKISGRLADTVHRLQSSALILGECGHGYGANRWEAPEWLATTPDFQIISIIELMADYIRTGRIKLDNSRLTQPVTLHDPCNLVRLGGIIEDQRYVLRRAVANFIEMYPNREKNFCCGGGGGQLSMTRYAARRIKSGKIKADQIRETKAKIVVTPCHNCIDQLSELNKEYKLGVQIKTLSEMVADAVILNKPADGR